MKKDGFISWGVFLGGFLLYLFTAGPTLVPYRDAGEMAILLKTLGVAHPPGYPLYTLVGHIFSVLSFGNSAYGANLFSGLLGAGVLAVLYIFLRRWIAMGPALGASLFLAFSHPFWELANVSEMYTMGLFFFMLLLWFVVHEEHVLMSAFLFGLALGVRMDLLLLGPIFLFWFLHRKTRINWCLAAFLFAIGLSIFVYLPIRARTNPMLDWAHPDSLMKLIASMTRKSYSGTLDLLSLSYKTGENFFSNMAWYGRHLFSYFGAWGVGLMAIGVWFLGRQNKKLMWFFISLFLISGPFFIFLANMPPNPHSLAIVEASYLVPDLILVLLIGWGAEALFNKPRLRIISGAVLIPLLLVNASRGLAKNNKRGNFYCRDYISHVWNSCPPRAVAVFHKDVQLFSLWYSQLIEGRRKDVSLVATGLSASPWYWKMKERWGVALAPSISLKSAQGWVDMKGQIPDRPFLVGYDVDIPSDPRLNPMGSGLLASLHPLDKEDFNRSTRDWVELAIYRGIYRYGVPPDFFSTDLIGDHARAAYRMGLNHLLNGQFDTAIFYLELSSRWDPTFPNSVSDLGYIYFSRGDFLQALRYYKEAVQKNIILLNKAKRYKSLDDVTKGLKRDLAGAYVSEGGTLEKLGRKEEARSSYLASLDQFPTAQAHFNLGVTYWGEDWTRVVTHMRMALQIDPDMMEAQKFLPIAEVKRRMEP